jgi:uncharacterized protein (DUF58 family)
VPPTPADGKEDVGWRPTASLVRASLTTALLAVLAVLVGRPDLLVLATPLLVHAVAAFLRRPRSTPSARSRLGADTLREGDGTTLEVTLGNARDVEHAVVGVTSRRWLASQPASGSVSRRSTSTESSVSVRLPVASLRWGRRLFGDGLAGALSGWAGYEWGPVRLGAHPLTTLPVPGRFDSAAPFPHPIGLVGSHPSRRRGDGYEFESIRAFRPGDRLRRLQWPVSLRTGELHVTSTHAEEDAGILLVLDGGAEVGVSGGLPGSASSLDVAVRAAGAVAEHHLTRGDRVGLRVLGAVRHEPVPMAAGRMHLRRVLGALARVVPGGNRDLDPERARFRVSAGTVVVVFSSMLSQASVAATTLLASRGLDVVIVDCLPPGLDLGGDQPHLLLAWRMRLLERRALLARAERAGIPVVAWRGPGTLDEVMRRLRGRVVAPGGRR